MALQVLAAAAGGEDQPINGLTLVDMVHFRREWFVRDLFEAGAADAVTRYGVGERVPVDQLIRGDFLQIWSATGAGHSAVFDGWARDGEAIVGIRYWSTHPLTAGVGYQLELVDLETLDPKRIYGARLARREDWVPPYGSGAASADSRASSGASRAGSSLWLK